MKEHLRRLHFQTAENLIEKVGLWLHMQNALFYHQSCESLNYGYGNFLNRYGDYVEK